MRLSKLQPHWLLRQDDRRFRREKAWVLKPTEADGIIFLCPKCFAAKEDREERIRLFAGDRTYRRRRTPFRGGGSSKEKT